MDRTQAEMVVCQWLKDGFDDFNDMWNSLNNAKHDQQILEGRQDKEIIDFLDTVLASKPGLQDYIEKKCGGKLNG